MKRLFWLALGASAGVLVVREARKTAAAMTPSALATSLTAALRDFGTELRLAMAEREFELRRDLGLDDVDAGRDADYPDARSSQGVAGDPSGEHPFDARLRGGH